MLAAPLTILSVWYPPVVYVSNSSHSFKQGIHLQFMLTAPLTVLSIRYPPVFMLAAPLTVLNIRYPPVVYVNISSHSFKHIHL